MTTTTHNITIEVQWTPLATAARVSPPGGEPACTLWVDTLAKLGVTKPLPFVPPFEVGDIITCGDGVTRSVRKTSPDKVYLRTVFNGYVSVLDWESVSSWKKIGEVTP